MIYDCIIVGGGLSGLQAAIQLGRYGHSTLVLDAADGRSTWCRSYNNLLGWPDGVSGKHLRRLGRDQAGRLGVHFVETWIERAEPIPEGFALISRDQSVYHGRRLLLATGVVDRLPPLEGLIPCLGISLFICPDCDGYEIRDRPAVIIGSGDAGAAMALKLIFWSKQLTYINHERRPLSAAMSEQLAQKDIPRIELQVRRLVADGEQLLGFELEDGSFHAADRGFVAFGGNEVRSGLAHQLGAERLENRHVLTDPRSKMTSVRHVWATGDIGVHAEQASIAMGEGVQAAIWMHKSLL
ncbi:NAD(P)/FAD-dependent oxidoreductase [Paenibacillus daejeonensis]|uniref:NAD(P)/FAD-dependent oxidoreductase n=1 Tax=Paenibacillus daejeonensis TaxID=135193 RepID=UPI000377D2B6|nr:NAD(P)/FAD-dependent oxidoreductase [Paenibacillus daejeonensis]